MEKKYKLENSFIAPLYTVAAVLEDRWKVGKVIPEKGFVWE